PAERTGASVHRRQQLRPTPAQAAQRRDGSTGSAPANAVAAPAAVARLASGGSPRRHTPDHAGQATARSTAVDRRTGRREQLVGTITHSAATAARGHTISPLGKPSGSPL